MRVPVCNGIWTDAPSCYASHLFRWPRATRWWQVDRAAGLKGAKGTLSGHFGGVEPMHGAPLPTPGRNPPTLLAPLQVSSMTFHKCVEMCLEVLYGFF